MKQVGVTMEVSRGSRKRISVNTVVCSVLTLLVCPPAEVRIKTD